MLNKTHAEHVLIALALQVVFALLTDNWWIGAAFGAALFIGREHAQAEVKARRDGYKYPELTVLYDRRFWSSDGVLDFVLPTLAVALLAFAMTAVTNV